MTAVGIIFSNIHDKNIPELTSKRSIASVPFGCRYRFIDFTLSNMVNSGIQKIGVITQSNYQSLMDHIGTGKDWDLASRAGGIKILPPNVSGDSAYNPTAYSTRLVSLKGAQVFLSRCKEDYVVLSDCDVICNIDLRCIIESHIENNADITLAVKKVSLTEENCKKNVILDSDSSGRVTECYVYPNDKLGEHDISLNIMVIRRDTLIGIIADSISRGYTSFNSDIIQKNVHHYNIRVYRYDGYFACVDSLSEYFTCSMQLLSEEKRHALFNVKDRPVLTKVRNSPPAKYAIGSSVSNSLIADGSIIEGTVENSIIFRGVHVCKGATVKNSIVMQDCIIEANASLNCMVLDKNVVIRGSRLLSGHESRPFFIEKGAMV